MEYYKNTVDDKFSKVGGKQCILTLDGYLIPLNIRIGLAYMDMRAPIGNEFLTLLHPYPSPVPHVVLTSDADWNPKVLDCEFDPDEAWEDAQDESPF